jgi:hypothetical protein
MKKKILIEIRIRKKDQWTFLPGFFHFLIGLFPYNKEKLEMTFDRYSEMNFLILIEIL